ncbi:hypothetical protein HOP50_02g12980 [Chloropicon primus]|uniref:Methyltransferase n=2 Tax=Chloropicon primus TaxID=1764295 RepID=A0A5B8MF53_9CHLO|nr:hypothetical protein A3770_02p13120 [Chloropicon primus]UPQ98001.1 hypothetical protein HOP50_02g12980 [Chloropicon primus]|eukprot:QDZ18794.1 hypothetical protein A3770_02p13120 [Chloropicon primus]
MGKKHWDASPRAGSAMNTKRLVWLLLAVCVFMVGKIYVKWTSSTTKHVIHKGRGEVPGLQEALDAIYERLDTMDQRVFELSKAQEKLRTMKAPKARGEEERGPPKNTFFLSQVKPGDICIFKATEKEESLVGMLGERKVSYSNHLGEVFTFTDSESGKIAFQRSSILAMMRSYKNGRFQMQANKKGRIVPKWYGDICEHKGTIESASGEKSSFFGRPCSSCLPWLLTQGIKEFNLVGLEEEGLWLDFGTRVGDTTKHLYKLRKDGGMIYTFDSFQGYPETVENTPFKEGKGAMNEDSVTLQSGWFPQKEGISDWGNLGIPETVKVVTGWFNESLPGFMEEHKGEPVRLVHIDSGIYTSAKQVLDALSHYVGPGTVIVFNDYTYCRDADAYVADHHPRAFFEFLADTGLGAQALGSTKYSGAWILLEKDDLPNWLRENKGAYKEKEESNNAAAEATEENAAMIVSADSEQDSEPYSASAGEGLDREAEGGADVE